jgi:REP element-mobilizing transposase RayT
MGEAYQIRDQQALYFLTLQVVGWADIFSRKVYRDVLIESLTYCRKEKGLEVFAYAIMTNHIHLIARSKDGVLSDTIRDFKKFTSKRILAEVRENSQESRREWLEMIFRYHAKFNKRSKDMQFWTHENHAIQLDSNEMIESRIDYIHENPVRAGWVEDPEDYLCSSARNYAGMNGLLEIDSI